VQAALCKSLRSRSRLNGVSTASRGGRSPRLSPKMGEVKIKNLGLPAYSSLNAAALTQAKLAQDSRPRCATGHCYCQAFVRVVRREGLAPSRPFRATGFWDLRVCIPPPAHRGNATMAPSADLAPVGMSSAHMPGRLSLERIPGIGPGTSPRQGDALPLRHIRMEPPVRFELTAFALPRRRSKPLELRRRGSGSWSRTSVHMIQSHVGIPSTHPGSPSPPSVPT
jgi:hypothetical protein